jgi:hypothetical protein
MSEEPKPESSSPPLEPPQSPAKTPVPTPPPQPSTPPPQPTPISPSLQPPPHITALVSNLQSFYTSVAPSKYPPSVLPSKCKEIIERYTNKSNSSVDVERLRFELSTVYTSVDAADYGIGGAAGASGSSGSAANSAPSNVFEAKYKESSSATNKQMEAYALQSLTNLKNSIKEKAFAAAVVVNENLAGSGVLAATVGGSSPGGEGLSEASALEQVREWIGEDRTLTGLATDAIIDDLRQLLVPGTKGDDDTAAASPTSPTSAAASTAEVTSTPPETAPPPAEEVTTTTRDYKSDYRTLLRVFHSHNTLYALNRSGGSLSVPQTLPPAYVKEQRRKQAQFETAIATLEGTVATLSDELKRSEGERHEVEDAIVAYLNIAKPNASPAAADESSHSSDDGAAVSADTGSSLPSSSLQTALTASLRTTVSSQASQITALNEKIDVLEKFKATYMTMKKDNAALKSKLGESDRVSGEWKRLLEEEKDKLERERLKALDDKRKVDELKMLVKEGVALRERMENRLKEKEKELIDGVDRLKVDTLSAVSRERDAVWDGVRRKLGEVDALAVKDMEIEKIEGELFELTREIMTLREKGKADEKSIRGLKDEIKRAAGKVVEMAVECEKRDIGDINFKT